MRNPGARIESVDRIDQETAINVVDALIARPEAEGVAARRRKTGAETG